MIGYLFLGGGLLGLEFLQDAIDRYVILRFSDQVAS
jgi:hypothetical protein